MHEAWFHLQGYVNSQNARVWAAENPHVYHEEPLHPLKVGVWCAISIRWIMGPIFFEETVNMQVYMNIFNTFVSQLDDEELQRGFFQQDGATLYKLSPFFFFGGQNHLQGTVATMIT
jgi:hypothetical protein